MLRKSLIVVLLCGVLSGCVGPSGSSDPERGSSMKEQKGRDTLAVSYEDLSDFEDFLLIDVREDEEREQGYLEGSLHIRAADVMGTAGEDLPKEQLLILYCFTGSRSREVAHFLAEKGYDVRFLNEELSDVSLQTSSWKGSLFLEAPEEAHNELSGEMLQAFLDEEAVLIDARRSRFYEDWHVEGSLSLPVLYTLSSDMDALLEQVPPSSDVIVACDPMQRSCFSAVIAAMKLQARGHRIIGRFSDLHTYRSMDW